MKILIFGFGNVTKALVSYFIKSKKLEILIVSRKKQKKEKITFLTYDEFNRLNLDLSNFYCISTVPPDSQLQSDFVISKVHKLKLTQFKRIFYLSSTLVYPSGIINENTPVFSKNKKGELRIKTEQQWKELGMNLTLVRIAGIYSHRSNLFINYLNGKREIIYKKNHFTNRIHLHDLIQIINRLINEKNIPGIINVVDENPRNTFESFVKITNKYKLPKVIKVNYTSKKISNNAKIFFETSKIVKSIYIGKTIDYKFKYPCFDFVLEQILKKRSKYYEK